LAPKRDRLAPSFKFSLRRDRLDILDEGGASLLAAIEKYGSISEAAKRTGISYKHAWNRLLGIEKGLGEPVLRRRRGGRAGGGSELTEAAMALLRGYSRVKTYLGRVLIDRESWEAIGLKISARNRLKGTVEKVDKGRITSSVKIEVQMPVTITAVISKEAVDDLDLKPGDKVEAVIKATEVMVAKE